MFCDWTELSDRLDKWKPPETNAGWIRPELPASWRKYDGPLDIIDDIKTDYLSHHGRMITATEALKRLDALRDKGRWERR
jgi:hypothetical protein